ncbi:hypothetical protein TorRG33x02_061510, partial [Trema orientale]
REEAGRTDGDARRHRTESDLPENYTRGDNFRVLDLSHRSSVLGVASRVLTISECSSTRDVASDRHWWRRASADPGVFGAFGDFSCQKMKILRSL